MNMALDAAAEAKKILGTSYDVAGKTDDQLRLDTVKSRLGDVTGKPPGYIAAAFDLITAPLVSRRYDSRHYREDTALPISRHGVRTPMQQARSDAARDVYIYGLERAWQD